MSCQNCVYVISRSLSTRQIVAGSDLLPLAGMLFGSTTCDLLVSTLMPRLPVSAAIEVSVYDYSAVHIVMKHVAAGTTTDGCD